jgi:hypothetical protein
VSKKVSMASRRFARGTVVTGLLMLAAAPLALAACSSAPSPTPDISPNPAVAPHDERITLPETMGLALRHPAPADRTEHQILYTVQQSIRSQLHAEYGPGANDPLLTAYWSGDGLAAVRREVAAWTKRGEQPVGVLVVSNVSYSAPGADGEPRQLCHPRRRRGGAAAGHCGHIHDADVRQKHRQSRRPLESDRDD